MEIFSDKNCKVTFGFKYMLDMKPAHSNISSKAVLFKVCRFLSEIILIPFVPMKSMMTSVIFCLRQSYMLVR